MSEAIERVLARVFKGLGCVLASLGAILASLGAPFGGSAALLGANMAEKNNKRAKKIDQPKVSHLIGRENRRILVECLSILGVVLSVLLEAARNLDFRSIWD